MKFFAALVIAAVNANDLVNCWEGEGANVHEFAENARRVECGKRELCAMTVRKRGGEVRKVYGGCKEALACRVNRHQNFAWRRQCKPEADFDENGAKVFSVCRSCTDEPWKQKKTATFTTQAEWMRNLL